MFSSFRLFNTYSPSMPTNETVGITLEYLLLMKYGLSGKYNPNRFKPSESLHKVSDKIYSLFQEKKIILKEYTGPQNTYYDFKADDGSTVSLKSNFNGYKVCPQNIGQISKEKWLSKFQGNDVSCDHKVVFMKNKESIVQEYWYNLFLCDHNIWARYEQQKWKVTYIPKNTSCIFNGKIETTRTIEQWNESNTLKYNGNSIGEIQIHRNRNCVKFRFNMLNCLTLLNV